MTTTHASHSHDLPASVDDHASRALLMGSPATTPKVAANDELFAAARRGDAERVRWLLQNGRQPHEVDARGYTLLHVAAEIGDLGLIEVLREYPSLLRATTRHGDNAVHVACRHRRADAFLRLVAIGAPMVATNAVGNTPLHLAAYYGAIEIVREILRADAVPIDVRNIYGEMPLHHAVRNGWYAIAAELIAKGSPVSSPDRRGWHPLHIAAYYGDATMISILLRHGADPSARNAEGRTPRDIALIRSPNRIHELFPSDPAETSGAKDDRRLQPPDLSSPHPQSVRA